MDSILTELNLAKTKLKLDRAFIFGSFVENKKKPNDIDLIFYTQNKNLNISGHKFSKPIKRIQYNCYKKDYNSNHQNKVEYDIVVIHDKKILNNFIDINSDRILEV